MKVYNINLLADKFVNKTYMLNMGGGKLSKTFGVTRYEIEKAKQIARNRLKYGTDYHPSDVSFKPKAVELPKILIFDIETSPTVAYTFQRFNTNIGLDNVIQDPIMLTWSAKWLHTTDVMSDAVTPTEILEFDDYRIVKSLWDLLNEADVVIVHFGDFFDLPFLNSRAVIHGLPPYTSIKSIDTKRVASSQFKFPSNKLDALGEYFGVGNKIKTSLSLWIGCMQGDLESIDKMVEYNKQDVVLLEEVYLKLRPWIKSHPNLGIYKELDETVCACCGTRNLSVEVNKFYYTQTTKYPIYRCNSCGGLTRGRKTVLDKTVGKTLGTSIPR